MDEIVLYDGEDMEINASTLYRVFKNEWAFRFGNSRVPKFSIKTAKLFREIIDEQGAQKSVDIIIWAMKNWAYLQSIKKITSLPTAPIVFGFRHDIMGLIDSPIIKKNTVSYDSTKQRENKRPNKNALLYRK